MATYNALEVMDQIAAPFQQGLTRAHELQRAAAGARVARSTQIGDLTAKRQYDEGVAQQQHLQGLERIQLAGDEGRKTADYAYELEKQKLVDIREQTLVDLKGTLHSLLDEGDKGVDGKGFKKVQTAITGEQIDNMTPYQARAAVLELTEQVQIMHAKKLTRDQQIEYLEDIDPKHKLWWAANEVLDGDDPRKMTGDELVEAVGQVKYRAFIWKNPAIVKRYDDLMNEQYRLLYDNGWMAVMKGVDERGQTVALPAGVQSSVANVSAMMGDPNNTAMLPFQTALQTALDNPEQFDRVMSELREGSFSNAVEIATSDNETQGQAGKALSDGLATIIAGEQTKQTVELQKYLFERQGDPAKLREIMNELGDMVDRHPLLEHSRTPGSPPGLDYLNKENLRSGGWISGGDSSLQQLEETGEGGAGVNMFQTPQAPVPTAPAAGPVTPTATGADGVSPIQYLSPANAPPPNYVYPAPASAPTRTGSPNAAGSAYGAVAPTRGGKRVTWEGTQPIVVDEIPFKLGQPGTPLGDMNLQQVKGDTGLAGEGEAKGTKKVEVTGGLPAKSKVDAAKAVIEEFGSETSWLSPFTWNRSNWTSDRWITEATRLAKQTIGIMERSAKEKGWTRGEKGTVRIPRTINTHREDLGPSMFSDNSYPGQSSRRYGDWVTREGTPSEIESSADDATTLYSRLDKLKKYLKVLEEKAERRTSVTIP